MAYQLRERPDGMVEIVINRPQLVGMFPDRAMAEKVFHFLAEEAIDWPVETVAAEADVVTDCDHIADDAAGAPAVFRHAPVAVVAEDEMGGDDEVIAICDDPVDDAGDGPQGHPLCQAWAPATDAVRIGDAPAQPAGFLTPEQRAEAFERLGSGARIAEVAPAFGVRLAVLRGMWAAHVKKTMAEVEARPGMVDCVLCGREFRPSASHPDTCARCSRD